MMDLPILLSRKLEHHTADSLTQARAYTKHRMMYSESITLITGRHIATETKVLSIAIQNSREYI